MPGRQNRLLSLALSCLIWPPACLLGKLRALPTMPYVARLHFVRLAVGRADCMETGSDWGGMPPGPRTHDSGP